MSEAEPTGADGGDAVGAEDIGVGAALLMADLESAIISAGDEIAVLRRVADAMPRAQPDRPDLGTSDAGSLAGDDPGTPATATEAHAAAPADFGPAVGATPAASVGLPAIEAGAEWSAAASLPDSDLLARDAPSSALSAASVVAEQSVALGTAVTAERRSASMSPPETQPGAPNSRSLPATANVDRTPSRDEDWIAAAPVAPWQLSPLPGTPAIPEAAALAPSAAPANSAGSAMTPEFAWPDTPVLEPVGDRAAAPVAGPALDRSAAASSVAGSGVGSGALDPAQAASSDGSRSGPTEGDVFLDGERVGRWMARHLARELGGPAASGTGFDPRIGPAWPGALHGN